MGTRDAQRELSRGRMQGARGGAHSAMNSSREPITSDSE
jgi:hypothetical protein